MDLEQLTPALVLTVLGASIVTTIIVGVITTAWKPTDEQKGRFGPLIALVVGLIVVITFGLLQGVTDWASLLLTGLLAGGGSMGAYDTAKAVTNT